MNAVLIGGLFGLSIVSGMLGLGVAFAAVPFLSFFMPDLVHQVQPLSLLLNGVTALFAVFGFAQGGFLDWRRAILRLGGWVRTADLRVVHLFRLRRGADLDVELLSGRGAGLSAATHPDPGRLRSKESGGDQRLCCHPAVVLLTAAASGHGTMGYAHRSSASHRRRHRLVPRGQSVRSVDAKRAA